MILAPRCTIATVAILTMAACSDATTPAAPPAPRPPVEVVYDLGGTAGSADITYTGTGGSTEQQNGVDVPLTTKDGDRGLRVVLEPGAFAYLSAQNKGDGSIRCSITADGVVVDEATSRGEYAIATCSGSVP